MQEHEKESDWRRGSLTKRQGSKLICYVEREWTGSNVWVFINDVVWSPLSVSRSHDPPSPLLPSETIKRIFQLSGDMSGDVLVRVPSFTDELLVTLHASRKKLRLAWECFVESLETHQNWAKILSLDVFSVLDTLDTLSRNSSASKSTRLGVSQLKRKSVWMAHRGVSLCW